MTRGHLVGLPKCGAALEVANSRENLGDHRPVGYEKVGLCG